MKFSVLSALPLLHAGFAETVTMAKASWRYALAFAFALAAGLSLQSAVDLGGWLGPIVSLSPGMILFCLWSYQCFQAGGLAKAGAMPRTGSIKLACAYGLFCMALFLIVFMLALFLIIFAVVLVIGSGYDPSQGDANDVTGSVEALRESGAIYLLYTMLFLAIAGFAGVLVRLAAFAPATVDNHQIMIFQTWRWTKHKILDFLPAMLALQLLPIVVIFYLAGEIGRYGQRAIPASMSGVSQVEVVLTHFAVSAVQVSLWLPAVLLGHGLATAIYKRVAPVK